MATKWSPETEEHPGYQTDRATRHGGLAYALRGETGYQAANGSISDKPLVGQARCPPPSLAAHQNRLGLSSQLSLPTGALVTTSFRHQP